MINVSGLKTDGFVYVSYPNQLRTAVEASMKSWEVFCKLPLETKEQFVYEKGSGYEIKLDKGERKDLKENFHTYIGDIARLKDIAKKISKKEGVEFIYDCENLINGVRALVLGFAESVGKEFSIEGMKEEVGEKENDWTIRFLHYFDGQKPLETIASPHVDKGGFTLHLYETSSGVQNLTQDGKWKELPVSSDETVIIPGMMLQLKSENQVKGLCHRVVSNEETYKNGRYSSVCFVDFKNTPKYNKGKYGRLQEFEAGFNYTCPFDDFKKLFKV